MSDQTEIKLCRQIGTMVRSYNTGTLQQVKWGQGYAVLFLGMAHQMDYMPFSMWCGSGRGKGDAIDQINTSVKDLISLESSPDDDIKNATIKTATLSVAWSLGIKAARLDPSMGLTFNDPLPNAESKGSIEVDLDKLKEWVKNGGILQRNKDGNGDGPVKWKQAKARATALIKSLDTLTVGDFPTDEGLPQLKEFNSLLGTLRAMEAMVNGIVTPAEVDAPKPKKTTKKRATRKAAA